MPNESWFRTCSGVAGSPPDVSDAPHTPEPVPANDPAPHFDPLFHRMEAVVVTHGYNNADIAEFVAAGARSVHAAAVGDWFRTALAERIISRATVAYFNAASEAAPGPPPSGA